ncbi:MAG: TIR domain-containing protein [Smithella sp.]
MATRKTITQPPIEVKKFTVPEIDAGIRKLRRRIEEVNGLSDPEVGYRDAKVTMTESNIRETIREVFGQNSPEFNDHQFHAIWDGGYNLYENEYEKQHKFLAGIPQTVGILEGLIARLEEKRTDLAESPHKNSSHSTLEYFLTRKVFVVHGHDEEAKQTVARFLEKLKLEAVVLSERPNEGRTIIEKFEKNSDVGFAIVLLTPDDMGYSKDDHDKIRPRARQNVILELGYFVGRLSRSKVCALYKGTIEMPSDFHGVIYLPMDEAEGWKLKIASELKQAGIDVDLNLAI